MILSVVIVVTGTAVAAITFNVFFVHLYFVAFVFILTLDFFWDSALDLGMRVYNSLQIH